MKLASRLALLLGAFLGTSTAFADLYVVGETNGGTQAILHLNYNSYGAGTVLSDARLTLRYRDGTLESMKFQVEAGKDGSGTILHQATQRAMGDNNVWNFWTMFSAKWGEQGIGGRVHMRYQGPSISQKGVPDVERGNGMNVMIIEWPEGEFWPKGKGGPYEFTKLKMYGFDGDEGVPSNFDEEYWYATMKKLEKLTGRESL